MSERAAPFYCPYCGDEDLRPSEAETGGGKGAPWECAACNRAFRLSFLGLLARGLAPGSPAGGGAPGSGSGEGAQGPEGGVTR
ncbi:hypothetical protein H181DRAFT_03813 [Streptomyces sp. WMMB 714]|jgi:predicted RNA-binding Zn-ribbon protein involved in translation (DUF1610 family)|uniref:hypothetical protein n=1 Tax=Streptomyces sp. WMMB 714 TaxID=1286822 RepID=UPI0005F7EE63|nr:hypothetical protein [Streptomyces sp. WMMB 714]SCK43518.1 hypothetical protein H181DRAFT_03813 [Streptomyces sp. WMMB 714]